MKKCVLTLCLTLFVFPTHLFGLTAEEKEQNLKHLEGQSTLPQIKRAAEDGDPDAQYALGYLHYYGRGVEQDTNLAKHWIKKAARQGQQQAVQAEKILLGTAPTIQPKVHPIIQPDGESPDQPHTPVVPRDDMKKEPVTNNDPLAVADIIADETPVLNQKENAKPTPDVVAPPKPKTADPLQKIETAISAGDIKPKAQEVKTKAPLVQSVKPLQADHFTIQLLSSSKKQDVVRFLEKANLKQARYYETFREGQKWYVVTYGEFSSRKAATSAIQKLPETVKKNGPWVKSSAMVNKEIAKKN